MLEILCHQLRILLLSVGARTVEHRWFYLVVAFALAYAAYQLKIPKAQILHVITTGAALTLFTMPFCGWLSACVGQGPLFVAPFFGMLETLHPLKFGGRWCSTSVWCSRFCMRQSRSCSARRFPPQTRYSGISLSVQVIGVLGGGVGPMVATAPLAHVGGRLLFVAYMVALGFVALACTLLMRAHGG